MKNKRLVISDLDACIFNDGYRLGLINLELEGDIRWAAYHAAHVDDKPYVDILRNVLFSAKDSELAFWTGRNVGFMPTTSRQLLATLPQNKDISIRMRPNHDDTPSPEMKSKWLREQMATGQYQEYIMYEDRADVLAACHEAAKAQISVGDKVSFRSFLVKEGEIIDTDFVAWWEDTPVYDEKVDNFDNVTTAADILDDMAETFRERNAVYGDNAVMVGKVMKVLFPNGVELTNPEDYHMWHLFELKIVKLTRFAISGLKHEDSIHDDGVYSAMCERLVNDQDIKIK